MTHLELTTSLRELSMRGTADALSDLVARATQDEMSPSEIVAAIVEVERRDRNRRSLERRAKFSRIGSFKPIADYDFEYPTKISRAMVQRAIALTFFEDGGNIVLIGPHGVGKTMILKNICHEAVAAGHTARFLTAGQLIGDLTGTDSPTALQRKIKQLCRVDLLGIDELGYLSYNSRAADLLFEIVSRRHEERRPIVLSTNLAYKDWGTVFPNATCTVALVDRLTHRADTIRIVGESWRRKEAEERALSGITVSAEAGDK